MRTCRMTHPPLAAALSMPEKAARRRTNALPLSPSLLLPASFRCAPNLWFAHRSCALPASQRTLHVSSASPATFQSSRGREKSLLAMLDDDICMLNNCTTTVETLCTATLPSPFPHSVTPGGASLFQKRDQVECSESSAALALALFNIALTCDKASLGRQPRLPLSLGFLYLPRQAMFEAAILLTLLCLYATSPGLAAPPHVMRPFACWWLRVAQPALAVRLLVLPPIIASWVPENR